jgi:cell division protein FtsI/penicillin-binding protein 2
MSLLSALSGRYKSRAACLLWLVLLWAVVAVAFHCYYAIVAREKYLKAGNRIAMRHGTYDGGRGRILDRLGRALAWSERRFDLFLFKLPEDKEILNNMMERIKKVLPDSGCFRMKETYFLVQRDIQPDKILELEPLLNMFPDLKILPRVERRVVDYPEIRSLIGKTKFNDGIQTGISGVELDKNSELSGTEGQYEVMLDRHKNWVRNTWQLIKKAAPGKDIKLSLTLEELIVPVAKQEAKLDCDFDQNLTMDDWEHFDLPDNINDLTVIDNSGK